MRVKIVAPDIDLTRPQFQADHGPIGAIGDTNPLFPLILQCAAWGLRVKNGVGTTAYIDGITDNRLLDISTVQQLVAMDLEVHGYPAFVRLVSIAASDEVPSFLLNAYHTDPGTGEQTTLKTWEEWAQNPVVAGEYTFIELNGGGTPEDGSKIVQLIQSGFTVLSAQDAAAQIAENQPEE